MELDLAVTVPGTAEPVEITVDFDRFGPVETVRAIELCGPEAFADLVNQKWNEKAGAALIQAAVERELGTPLDTPIDLDWGDLAPYLMPPDRELEATIPMEEV